MAFQLAIWIFKIIASAAFSLVAYWFVLGFVHVAIYAYLIGANEKDLWIGDSLGLLFQAVPILIAEFAVFYWSLSHLQKKLESRYPFLFLYFSYLTLAAYVFGVLFLLFTVFFMV